MPARDDSPSLRELLVRRWKEELFSADTVVAAVSVLVALPAGLAAALVVTPEAAYPVMTATAVGPGLGYWRGLRIEVDGRTAALVGAGMAAVTALGTAAAAAVAVALGADTGVAIVTAGALGILLGGVLGRVAFHRLAGRAA